MSSSTSEMVQSDGSRREENRSIERLLKKGPKEERIEETKRKEEATDSCTDGKMQKNGKDATTDRTSGSQR